MKATFNTLLAVVAALAIAGCASTPQQVRTDYPSMKVLSPTPYVWDNSKSVALNVAKMAEPAGVGVGMKDYATAVEATNGQSSTTERVLGGVVMGLSQGVFGLLSTTTQSNRVDAALAWQPSLVDLIPVSEIGTDLNPQAFLKIRAKLSAQIRQSISSQLPDAVWHEPIYSSSSQQYASSYTNILTSSKCHDYMKFHSYRPDEAPQYNTKDYSSQTLEKIPYPAQYCSLRLIMKVATTTTLDGTDYYVVVSSFEMGQNFIEQLAMNYPGYIIVPDTFSAYTLDGPGSVAKVYPHAFVLNKGKFEYFVTPK